MFNPKSIGNRRAIIIVVLATSIFGCQSNEICPPKLGCDPCDLQPSFSAQSYLSLPDEPCIDDCGPIDSALSPLDINDYGSIEYEDFGLQECIDLALKNSKVFRDLGGTIISNPQTVDGVYDPAITTTDPRFSEDAALSAFDANFSAAAFFQNNDQASNLTFQGNNGVFKQDFHDYRYSLQKLAATGTIFTLSNFYNYDNSNQTGQTLSHTWQTIFQGEFRHPLLQGSGVSFNRIAGPSTQSGVYGGVLIARTNTEISMSQFVEGVRDLVSEVENAYWDLFFAYRNLEATVDGRDKAYEILVKTTESKSREGTQAQAQAKEQYLRFEANVLDAMEGRPTFGTRNNNGMSGGVFLSPGGIRVTERRLRLICGLPINGGRLIRTVDEPASTGVQFDWHQSVDEAFCQRQELLQQRWLVKQRELQLMASKNFLRPRLDVIGQYRFRGLGRTLTGSSTSFQEDLNNGSTLSSAYGDLFSGDFQEWQLGAEFSMPLGFRSAHLGVRNAEIALSRERALLQEQKREVVFGLSNAFGELRRTYAALRAAEEQYVAAREFQFVMNLEVQRGRDQDIELEAQRRVVEAEISFRQAQVEYMLALKSVHFEKGTYLQFCNVRLTESASNPQMELDAVERISRRGREISYVTDSPIIARPRSQNPPFSAAEAAGIHSNVPAPESRNNAAPVGRTFTFPENFESNPTGTQKQPLNQPPSPPVSKPENNVITALNPNSESVSLIDQMPDRQANLTPTSILNPLPAAESIPSSRRADRRNGDSEQVRHASETRPNRLSQNEHDSSASSRR